MLPEPTILVQLVALGFLLGGIYGFTALGLTVIFGVMDVVNVAHGAFVMVGMYVVFVTATVLGLPAVVGIPLAGIGLFVLGVGIERATLSPIVDGPEQNKFLVTVAFLILLVAAVEFTFGATPRQPMGGEGSVGYGGVFLPRGQVFALGVAAVTVAGVWLFLRRTHTGRAIRGTADNRVSSAYAGVNVSRIDAITFGLGAGLAGLAGAMITFVQPFDPYLGNTYLTIAFVVVVLGGLGSIFGTVAGGLLVGMLRVFGDFYLGGSMYNVLILLVFIGVLLFRPTGLFGKEHHD